MTRSSPTVRLRRLSALLRLARQELGWTASQAAQRAGWQQSALSRAETMRWRRPNLREIQRLLDAYGITEEAQPERREMFLSLARDSRQRGWWADYHIPDDYQTYVGLETEASAVRNWEPVIVPGLLQTAAYARAIIRAGAPHLSDREVEDRVELRLERQRHLLHGSNPLFVWALVSESALHHLVGGPEVMIEQLEHLKAMVARPTISLQILPFRAGAPPSTTPWSLLTFTDPLDPEVVYCETSAGDMWVEGERVDDYKIRFEWLVGNALTVPATLRLVQARIHDLQADETAGR
ncbi:helix-turn-helix transcriptional regulator [Actinomadura viridis]|uniref:helix-turn-helix domain-containing protein n=1 Tax=Actinomadura viridis TaxID=58110 RepID=UPI0036B6CAA7